MARMFAESAEQRKRTINLWRHSVAESFKALKNRESHYANEHRMLLRMYDLMIEAIEKAKAESEAGDAPTVPEDSFGAGGEAVSVYRKKTRWFFECHGELWLLSNVTSETCTLESNDENRWRYVGGEVTRRPNGKWRLDSTTDVNVRFVRDRATRNALNAFFEEHGVPEAAGDEVTISGQNDIEIPVLAGDGRVR